MITPGELKEKAVHRYRDYCSSIITEESLFPLEFSPGRIKPSEFLTGFSRIDREIQELINRSKEVTGSGYTLEFRIIDNRSVGKQRIIDKILFETEDDYLKFTGKIRETELFRKNAGLLLNEFPILKKWCARHPLKIIHEDIGSVLKVLRYFTANPCPDLYIRELPIDINTKFIEQNKPLLREMLDILIAPFVNHHDNNFEKRFNLKFPSPLIRFRILDRDIANRYFSGMQDISIPADDFARLVIPVKKIIILENKTSFSNIENFLTLPDYPGTIALFGSGNAVQSLALAEWINSCKIYYWGDIDPHGFMILSTLRKTFHNIQSLLMDKRTLDNFRGFMVRGETLTPPESLYLTDDECRLFNELNTSSDMNRLEQELIPHEYVKRILTELI